MSNLQRPSPSTEGHHGEMFSPHSIASELKSGSDDFAPVASDVARIFADGLARHLEYKRNSAMCVFSFFVGRCDSNLERKMLAALVFMADGFLENQPAFRVRMGDDDTRSIKLEPHFAIGPYTVDFAVHAESPFDRSPIKIAVECDGHYWHDRTPEQATKDKKRDRFLAAHGYTVLRFTESEINANVHACADQVEAIITRAQEASIAHSLRDGAA